MAMPPSKGKQPSAEYKPSRLRQQVNPESTDDERVPESHSIQSPDSQIVVPESQFDHPEDIRTDEQAPLSPRTTAMLERTTVRKNTESAKPLETFTGQLFSRPAVFGESTLRQEPAVRFTFGQPPNAAKKPALNVGHMVAQPDIESPHTQLEADQGARAVTPLANLPDMTADELPNKLLHNDGSHTRESQTPASGVLNVPMILGEEDGSRVEPPGVFLEHLPSAPTNTESVDGKKKIRVAKKGKKGRKGQHRGVPWPPRPLGTTSIQTEPMPAAEAAFEDTIEAPMVSCPAVVEEDTPHPPSRLEADLQQDTDRSSRLPPPSTTVAVPPSVRTSRRTQILPPGAGRTPAKDVSQKCAQRSVPHLPFNDSVSNSSEEGVVHDAEVGIQHDDEAVHEPQLHMEDGHGMVQDQQCPKVDLPHVSPEHGHQLISDTPSCLPLEQSHRPLRSDLRDDATLLNQEGPALHLPAEHKSRKRHAPRPRPGYNNVRHSQGPTDQLQTTTEVNSHVPQVDKSLARRNHQQQQVDGNLAHGQHDPYYADGNVFHEGHLQQPVDGNLAHVEHRHQQQADAVLHGISDLNGPYRIGKAQKKRRPQHQVMAPMSFRNLESVPQIEFDKALVTLSTAHHADQSRKDRDIEKEAEYSKEVKALLQAQINQLTETISEWKGKFAALNTVVIDFREKAKTNQKFVSGLQKDHEKLQKSVVTIRDECKKALREKIAELEHEKSSLLRQFDTTLASLEKGQKKAKGTIDELYVDLRISQSKRKDLEGNLTKQIAMYEEEKSKRNDLEKRLLPSVQTVQRLLDDRSTQLIKSLDALRTSLDGVAANKETDASLQECVDTLRKIQARPSLTSKDLERSEGMLRFVHNGLCAKLEALVESVENRTDPTENIQTIVSTQLQGLQSEMLKFDEVEAESRKAQGLNGTLNTELAAEREKANATIKQIETLGRQEERLKEQKVQLERRLAEANDRVRDQNTDKSTLQKDAEDLRQQLKLAEDECREAKVAIERLEKKMQKRDKRVADFEKSIEILRDDNNKLAEAVKNHKSPDPIELRKDIEKALLQEFSDNERNYHNDIHRLSEDLKEKKKLIREHDKKMDAAKSKCEESKNAAKGLQSQLNEARKEKTEIEETLKTLQYAAQVECSNAAEMGKLKEQLRQKIEELREKIQEHTKLEREHAELQTSKRNLHVLFEQQQTEMSQHSARIDSLRQEIEAERSTEKEQSKNAIDLARSQTRTLEKEKSGLQAKLEHVRCSDSKLNEAHAALVAERDGLRSRNTELEAAEKASGSQTTRAYEEKADAVRKFEQRLNDLQRDQEHSDAALKEAEAKIQLQKTEHRKKIEFDRQKYESIVKTLTEELSKVRAQGTSLSKTQQQDLNPTSLQKPKLHSPQTVQTGKTRKKVSRENQTVLDVAGLSGTLVSASAQGTTRERNQGSDQSDNLFDEDHDIFGSDKLDKDQGCSIIDPAAVLVEDAQDIGGVIPPFVEDTQEVGGVFPPFVEETQDIGVFPPFVEDTQDIGGALVPFGNIANQLGQKPGDESSLSGPMTSDGLDQLEGDVRAVCTPVPEKHHRTQDSSREMIPETPIRHENAFLSGSYSSKSNGRPRSQANTASRLMPPPGTVSAHFDQPKLSPTVRSKNVSREDVDSKKHRSSGRSNDSSPGFEDHPFSFSNRNYDARRRSKIGKAVELPEHGQSQKRKLNFDQDVGSKRQRTPSQSLSHRLSPGSRPYSPHRSHSKPSRPSAGRGSAKSQASPSSNDILMHPSGSSDHARHTSSRTPSTKSACQSRSQESSTSSHAARLYGRRQTRSKTQDVERFDREIRGG